MSEPVRECPEPSVASGKSSKRTTATPRTCQFIGGKPGCGIARPAATVPASEDERMEIFLWVLGTVVTTVFVTLIVLNLLPGEKKIQRRIEHAYDVDDPQFLRAMGHLLPPPVLGGNRVEALYNGDQIFPAMLDAIRGAKISITFETFIYWEGRIGRAFADALAERAQAGVRVHALVDWLGSKKMDASYLRDMEQAGVQVERFHPIRWYSVGKLNNRTHRKLLVVDGTVGFTGGVGIADEWTGDAQDAEHWRDTHFRLEGPAVAQMQAAFMDNWIEVTGDVLHGPDYFPELPHAGKELAQFFVSSPGGGGESAQLLYLMSIAAAGRSIELSAAYFLPDNNEVRQLVAARNRGVRVQIIVPGPVTDSAAVRRASRSTWGELLRAGIEIYEYQPTFYHVKVMTVDGLWVSVGSTNFEIGRAHV